MTDLPARGEVWWCELPQIARRPVVVLSRDVAIPRLRRAVKVASGRDAVHPALEGSTLAAGRQGREVVAAPDPRIVPMASFHQRLKDRKLVQWAIAYLAGAWVVYEVSSTIGGHWGLPDGFFRALFVVLGVGFAGTLVLAWYHGEKGRQRVSGPELLMLTALFVIAAGLLAVIGDRDGGGEPAPRVAVGGGADDRPAVAVLPCDNLSPDSGDAYLAAGIHEEILLSLQRIPTLLSIVFAFPAHHQ